MSPHIAHEDLSAYVDGEIPSPRRAEITAHVGACGECAAILDELRWTVAFTSAMPITDLPEGAVLGSSRASRDGARSRRRLYWAVAAAVAAVAVLASTGLPQLRLAVGEPPAALEVAMVRAPIDAARGAGSGPVPDAALEADAGATRAFARRPTPDSARAGYPRPLSTARQGDLEQRGAVPPPEYGGVMDVPTVTGGAPDTGAEEGSGSTPALARAEGVVAAPIALDDDPTRATDTSRDDGMAVAAPGARPATPLADDAGAAVREAGARNAMGPAAVSVPGRGAAAAIAIAGVLLVLSAALFVRGWNR